VGRITENSLSTVDAPAPIPLISNKWETTKRKQSCQNRLSQQFDLSSYLIGFSLNFLKLPQYDMLTEFSAHTNNRECLYPDA